MPAFIHDRAEHILAKNPDMKKSTAFAIATQQSHALGKTPKGYGTAEGKREAKAKYDTPKDDVRTANPGNLKSEKFEKKAQFEGFFDELAMTPVGIYLHKQGSAMDSLMERMKAKFDELFKVAKTEADIDTKGTLDQNIETPQKGTNHVSLGAGEEKGVPAEGYLWGQDPPADQPLIGKRSPTHETLTSAGEEINKQQNNDLLHRIFDGMGAASDEAKRTIEQNFDNGRRGTYVTHSQTLLEKVRNVTGRA